MRLVMMSGHFDPIHAGLKLPPIADQIIRTIEFQRLRNLKQLGVSSYVFPGAGHTRYEHCIGTAYLCQKFLCTLENNSSIQINAFNKLCVVLAGLMHDIGHGPFSHMWDHVVHPVDQTWSHEETSGLIIRSIFQSYDHLRLSDVDDEHERGVDMIVAHVKYDLPVLKHLLPKREWFLSEIVSNGFCGIDVDKWDYLLRDSYYLRNVVTIEMAFERCFEGARVTADGEHISFREADHKHVVQLFENRAKLHRLCYKCPAVMSVEQLMLDALQAADEGGFRFKGIELVKAHTKLELYRYLDDSVVHMIEMSDDMRLRRAQQYLLRLKKLDFYPVVSNAVPSNNLNKQEVEIFLNLPLPGSAINSNVLYHDANGEVRTIPKMNRSLDQLVNQYVVVHRNSQFSNGVH